MTEASPGTERPSRRPTIWGLVVVGVGSTIVFPFLALLVVITLAPGIPGDEAGIVSQIASNWVCVAILLAIVLRAERLPLSSIGFVVPRASDVWLGAAFWLAALIATGLVVSLTQHGIDAGPVQQLLELPIGLRVALFVTAPVTEEILFRGYALERVASLTGRMWAAAAVTMIAFVAVHAPFYGLAEALLRIPVTLALTGLYVWRRSIWSVIVMHLLFNLPLLLAGGVSVGGFSD